MKDITKEKLIFLFIPVFAIIIIAIIIYVHYIQEPSPTQALDKQLPPLSAPLLLKPNQYFSNTLFYNQIELISFWNSKCESCEEQQGILMFLANAQLVAVYGIDFRDSPQGAKQFLAEHGNPFKAIAVDKDGRIGMLLDVNVIPETFLIDQDGKVRDEIIGPITPIIWFERLKPEIEELKKKQSTDHSPQSS